MTDKSMIKGTVLVTMIFVGNFLANPFKFIRVLKEEIQEGDEINAEFPNIRRKKCQKR